MLLDVTEALVVGTFYALRFCAAYLVRRYWR